MAVCTDPGEVRSQRGRGIRRDAALGLAILADGMGDSAGEVASSMATRCSPKPRRHAGRARAATVRRRRAAGLPTTSCASGSSRPTPKSTSPPRRIHSFTEWAITLVVAWFYDNMVTLAILAIPRAYRFARKSPRTPDARSFPSYNNNSTVASLAPEEARFSEQELVTRALGVDPDRLNRKSGISIPRSPGCFVLFGWPHRHGRRRWKSDDDAGAGC